MHGHCTIFTTFPKVLEMFRKTIEWEESRRRRKSFNYFCLTVFSSQVSDRQSYLVISLVLCVVLGLMLCMQRCRNTSQFDGDYISKLPKSNQYPSPKR
jgi:hypothetical protein